MLEFHLYRSGIKDGVVYFGENEVLFSQRNVVENKWGVEEVLTKQEGKKLADYYHINPQTIYDRWSEFKEAFQTDEKKVKTSWGALYCKDEESRYLWVEREKKFPLDVVVVDGEPVAFISVARENCNVLVRSGFENYTPLKLWNETGVSPAEYGINHLGKFMVPMRDSVKLATEVWLPAATNQEDAFPIIFVRTPYGRMMYEQSYVHFIQRGYGVVIQDTRGREDSEGDWLPMSLEVEDGDDSLNWINEQSWCDGNIGMIGASYGGFVQWAAAASGNPHLKALVSIVTAGSPFIDIPRKGGTLVSGMLAWTFAMVEKKFKPENMVRTDWDDVLKTRPLASIPKKTLGFDVPFWDQWMQHNENGPFWDMSSWSRGKQNIKVPAMIVSGWFDDNGMGTTEALEAVENYKGEDKKVILGPWLHQANTTRDVQGIGLGNNALRYDLDLIYQQWFDRKLKNIENDMDAQPRVEYYDTGANEWKNAKSWPPEDVAWKKLYLNSNGAASSEKGGTLETVPTENESYDTFVYDPEHPAPHIIDMSENEIGAPADYQKVEERDDVLVYNTAPLEEAVMIAGDIQVTFYASSSARDTDWVVRLTDVSPDGRSTKLVDGVLRARFRDGFEEEALLEPGCIEEYRIRTSKIATTFKKGHRIRLTITSSADSFIFPNTNTGNDPATDTQTTKATQHVFHSKEYPSNVELPVSG